MMKSHNWFGFRESSRGYQSSVRGGYGVYASSQDAIRDYAEWESQTIIRHGLNSETAFRRWITRHYAEDPQYAQKLYGSIRAIHQTELTQWH